jgi:predicted Zn-dependent peptidase
VIAGDFDSAAVANRLRALFEDWRPAGEPLPQIEAAVPESGRRVLLVDKPGASQTYFWIGNVGVSRSFGQRAELDIANTLFGGRYTSLLMSELRTKSGLTYDARSSLLRPTLAGSVAIVSYTRTEATIEAVDLAIALLAQMRDEGFSDALIRSAKNYILGQFPLRLETSAQLARQLATLEAYGLGAGYINDYGDAIAGADSEAIQSVITSVYPDTDDLVFVILGDADTIRDDVAHYGPVTEMTITEPRFSP